MKPLSTTRSAVPPAWKAPAETEGVIDLSADYSHFTVPGPVSEAVVHAAQTTDLGRVTERGGRHLRDRIVAKLRDVNGLEATPEGIVVTSGFGCALSLTFATLSDVDDEFLVPDPGWPGYERLCASWGVRCVRYPLNVDGVPDYDALERLVTERTKALLLSQPSTPLGSVLTAARLQEVCEFARSHDLYLISDETCDMIRYAGGLCIGPARYDTDGRVIALFSFAKTHAMAGLRLGYCVAAPPLAAALERTQEALQIGPSSLAITAGVAALDMDRIVVQSMTEFYRQQRDSALAMLPPEAVPHPAEAGYHQLVDISSSRFEDGAEFARACYDEAKLIVAPGPLYGQLTRRMIRVTLANREHHFGAGLERLIAFLEDNAA